MSNPNVGEKEIKLGGKTYTLKLTFLGIAEAENRLGGVGLSHILTRFSGRYAGIQDVTAIIYGAMIGHAGPKKDPPLSFEDLGDAILKEGLISFLPIAAELATFGMTGKWPSDFESIKKKSLESNPSELTS